MSLINVRSDDAAVTYIAGTNTDWTIANRRCNQGEYRVTRSDGDSATFTFTGTAVWLDTTLCPEGAIAYLVVDDRPARTYNLRAEQDQCRSLLLAADGLDPARSHTLRVTRESQAGGANWLDINGFRYSSPPPSPPLPPPPAALPPAPLPIASSPVAAAPPPISSRTTTLPVVGSSVPLPVQSGFALSIVPSSSAVTSASSHTSVSPGVSPPNIGPSLSASRSQSAATSFVASELRIVTSNGQAYTVFVAAEPSSDATSPSSGPKTNVALAGALAVFAVLVSIIAFLLYRRHLRRQRASRTTVSTLVAPSSWVKVNIPVSASSQGSMEKEYEMDRAESAVDPAWAAPLSSLFESEQGRRSFPRRLSAS